MILRHGNAPYGRIYNLIIANARVIWYPLTEWGDYSVDRRLEGYETLVFDIGNVLLRWDPAYLETVFFPEPLRAGLHEAVFGKGLQWGRFDLGKDDNAVIARDIAERSGIPEAEKIMTDMVERFHLYMKPLPLTEQLEEARSKCKKLLLLTNYPQPSLRHAMEYFPFFRFFDGYVCSSEEKLVKPGEEIFRVLIKRFGVDPEKALFTDDSRANTDTAEKLGFHIWNYKDFAG